MIATRAGGLPDKVRPGVNGWLVEPDDVPGLALGDRRRRVRARDCSHRWASAAARSSSASSPGRCWPISMSRCTTRCSREADAATGSEARVESSSECSPGVRRPSRGEVAALAVILGLGAWFRFTGLSQGIPFSVGVDEPEIIDTVTVEVR